jgi:hypothetical protein
MSSQENRQNCVLLENETCWCMKATAPVKRKPITSMDQDDDSLFSVVLSIVSEGLLFLL